MATYYLFLDFETEGLNIPEDRLLEAGWVLTDSNLDAIESGAALMKGPTPCLNSFVTKMHEESGLSFDLADPDQPKHTVWEVERLITSLLDDLVEEGDKVVTAGSGVDFDKRQIRYWMPDLDARLHYQLMDTSQIRRFLLDVCDIDMSGELEGADKSEGLLQHRALDDAEMARRELIRYRSFLEGIIEQ